MAGRLSFPPAQIGCCLGKAEAGELLAFAVATAVPAGQIEGPGCGAEVEGGATVLERGAAPERAIGELDLDVGELADDAADPGRGQDDVTYFRE